MICQLAIRKINLKILREQVLGEERFDYAFRKYVERWAFKHPTPFDFFKTIEDAAGEDLGWFWKGWFYTTWKYDAAALDVRYVEQKPEKGAFITVENMEKMLLPLTVELQYEGGTTERIKLPIEVFQNGGRWTFKVNSTKIVMAVIVDPDHVLPDTNPTNNTWTPGKKTSLRP